MLAYRSDIDGLRAVAVLSVILFHAGIPGFSGGYVGVDVFFVISGFLIASIILRELDAQKFSIATFYERRIRRIFPALFAVLGASWVAGYLWALPDGMVQIGRTMLAATLFVSNFAFWMDTGYFSGAAETKPLLHTWSLCVEEQFYVVFPLLLAAVHRFKRTWLPVVTAAVAVLSFALSVWGVRNAPESTFFLAHTRAWELLVGALLALRVIPQLERPIARHVVGVVGLGLILFAATCFTPRTPFPGPYALVPCLGTAALIHAGTGGQGVANRLLGLRVPVAIGLVSYGLYLWHWPILVFARELTIRALGPTETAACLVLTVLASLGSYYAIEKPIRERHVFASRRAVFGAGAAAMVGASAISLLAVTTKGLPDRVPSAAIAFEKQGRGNNVTVLKRYCRPEAGTKKGSVPKRCIVGDRKAEPSFLVWGDSHATVLTPAIAKAAAGLHRSGIVRTLNACAPLLKVHLTHESVGACAKFNDRMAKRLENRSIKQVILASRWAWWVEGTRYKNEYGMDLVLFDKESRSRTRSRNPAVFRRGLVRTLEALKRQKKRVVVALSVPEVGWPVPSALARAVWWGRALDIRPTRSEYDARQRTTLEIFRELQGRYGFSVVDPAKWLCGKELCEVERNGKLFYRDDDHVTDTGARLLAKEFAGALALRSPAKRGTTKAGPDLTADDAVDPSAHEASAPADINATTWPM